MILDVLAALALVLAGLFAGLTLANLIAYGPPPRPRGGAGPRVSVLVPARDEAGNVGPLLDGLLAQRGVEVEVIVLDDNSTDGTAELVRARAASDPRVRLIPGAPLPPGWIGKQHACAQAAEAATHPLLLFVDADVRLAPDAAARMARLMDRRKLDLLSGFPHLPTGSLGEALVVPQIMVTLLGYLPIPMARASRSEGFAAACGQLLMARREAYDRAGGHAAMRATIHDGINLARNVRRSGGRTDLCDLTSLATCRMYRSWPEVWRGFLKNAREGMATPRALPIWTTLLAGGHVLPLVLVPVAWAAGNASALGLAAMASALLLAARAGIAIKCRQGWLPVLLHPAGIVAVLVIQWTALLGGRRRLPAVWRGRTYDV